MTHYKYGGAIPWTEVPDRIKMLVASIHLAVSILP